MHCSTLRARINDSGRVWLCCLTLLLAALFCPAQNSSKTNRVLKLNGSNSYVQLPPDIFKNLTQATVEAWAKWNEFLPFSRVFEFGAGYQSVSLFNHSTNADLRFNIYPRFAKFEPRWMHTATARGLLRTSEWMHLAAVSGPGGMRLYANGRLVAQHTNTTTFADIDAAHTNVLGRGLARGPQDRDFKGEIDEVRVWNHRRTLDEIRENMFKRMSGREEGLTHLWNFDDGTAHDSGPSEDHGRLMGRARIGSSDLDLALAQPSPVVATPVPVVPAPGATNMAAAAIPTPVHVAITAPPDNSNVAAWWIAGSLVSLVAMLACLMMMLRRSGLGTARLLQGMPAAALPDAPTRPLAAPQAGETDKEMKERALADLTDFAKQSLVQGLYSQSSALLEVHQKAQQELAELEARVVALRLPDRIHAYEKRIAELESQLDSRSDELHELTQATLQVLRQRLEEEKEKEKKPGRFN